jgi:hypothetical protein
MKKGDDEMQGCRQQNGSAKHPHVLRFTFHKVAKQDTNDCLLPETSDTQAAETTHENRNKNDPGF